MLGPSALALTGKTGREKEFREIEDRHVTPQE